jgi:hypothetical protein
MAETKKYYPWRERIKSIKFTVFILVWIPSVAFFAMNKLTGGEFVTLMTLIVGIFTVAHEHTKRLGFTEPPSD